MHLSKLFCHLPMLQFDKYNKLIIFLFFFLILIFLIINQNSCFKVPPYGYINGYSSLAYSRNFCVSDTDNSVNFTTNSAGARILINNPQNEYLKVFGDSQVLGFDVSKLSDHYLYKFYPNQNFIIFAAPNNGPYEVINSLDLNLEYNERVVVNFNASTDLFRMDDSWIFYDHVPLSVNQVNYFSYVPIFYDFFKLLIYYFDSDDYELFNNNAMQELFLKYDNSYFLDKFDEYFHVLDSSISSKGSTFDYFISHPYWVYDFNDNLLIVNEEVYSKYDDLMNSIFAKYPTINISKVSKMKLKKSELTLDKRHLRSINIFDIP